MRLAVVMLAVLGFVLRRRALAILGAGVLALAPEPAAASSCFLGPFATSADLPVGCPIHAWRQHDQSQRGPRVTAQRDGQLVELAATIEKTTVMLRVDYLFTDCDGVEQRSHRDEPYERSVITLDGALAGDEIYVESARVGRVVEAGACPAEITPSPSCSGREDPCPGGRPIDDVGDRDGGCSVGGGAGLAIGLLAIAMRRRRRR